MSSVRDPLLKKQLAYSRDHYAKGKFDKRYRKNWPKIKKRLSRAGRHLAEEIVRQATTTGHAVLPTRAQKKHQLRKRYSPTLQETVKAKQRRRQRSVGAKKKRKARALSVP